jgi:hypothetical protein
MTGTIGYAVSSGLGIQTRALIDNGVVDKIFIVPHSHYKKEDWYSKSQVVGSIEELLDACDSLVFIETPFFWDIIPKARERGIKTTLIAMYECTPYPFPYSPDVLLGCSAMETEHYKKLGYTNECEHINAPVDIKWKQRNKARVFVHNSGHGGLLGRNSTKEVLEAMNYVKSPIKLIVRSQNGNYKSFDSRVEIINESVPYEELWEEGDILLLPEKFGGSFLPMQEAFASGMGVMATDRFPTNDWLPKQLLIKPVGYKQIKMGSYFQMAEIDPVKIAQKIDGWYNEDISEFSKMGKRWGENNNWKSLKNIYIKAIK